MFFSSMIFRKGDNNPIIFIPGIYGSMGNDIIPRTGEFSFGMAKSIYMPIINNLEDLGYRLEKDLFIVYYDWRKKNLYSAKKYLIPMIRKVKEITGAKKINIICHSMGGIVARAYIQSELYVYDVDKLIMIGTPNSGSVNAYYFWGGGQMPYPELRESLLYRIVRESFLWIFKRIYNEDNTIELLHKFFPSVQELLPTSDYGNYIFCDTQEGCKDFLPNKDMKSKNIFLTNLNRDQNLIYRRGVKVYLITGIGVETNKYIYVDKNQKYDDVWLDGKPINMIKTILGDGTVIYDSVNSLEGNIIVIEGSHTDILKISKDILSKILDCQMIYKKKDIEIKNIIKYVYSIVVTDVKEVDINTDEKNIIVNRLNFDEHSYWIEVELNCLQNIELKVIPLQDKESNIVIFFGEEGKYIRKLKEVKIKSKLIMKIDLN